MWDRASGERSSSAQRCKHGVVGYPSCPFGKTSGVRERYDMALDSIRTVVRCEALAERIMGGDRADESGVFFSVFE